MASISIDVNLPNGIYFSANKILAVVNLWNWKWQWLIYSVFTAYCAYITRF